MATIFDKAVLAQRVHALIQQELEDVAEQIAHEATLKYRAEIRKIMGKAALKLIEQDYSIERRGSELLIHVRLVDESTPSPTRK